MLGIESELMHKFTLSLLTNFHTLFVPQHKLIKYNCVDVFSKIAIPISNKSIVFYHSLAYGVLLR